MEKDYYSYELTDVFEDLCEKRELKRALELVDECFEKFPKESDNITKILLTTLLESTKIEEERLFYKYLLRHLEIQYSCFLFSMA